MAKNKNKKVVGIRKTYKKKLNKVILDAEEFAKRTKTASSILRNKHDYDVPILDNSKRGYYSHERPIKWQEGKPTELFDQKVGGTVKINTDIESNLRKVADSLKQAAVLLDRIIDDIMISVNSPRF